MLAELEAGEVLEGGAVRPKWHYDALLRMQLDPNRPGPSDTIHAVIVATVKETRETLEATIKSVIGSDFNMKQVIFILAYEERAGQETEIAARPAGRIFDVEIQIGRKQPADRFR